MKTAADGKPEHGGDASARRFRSCSRSSAVGDLAKRLTAVIAQLRNLDEGGVNPHHRYTFVSLGQVTDPVRAAMAAAGVIVMPTVVGFTEEEWSARSGSGVKVTVTVDFTWVAAESGEWMTTRWVGHGLDTGDKAFTKAYSSILKSALMKTFLISSADGSADDPDNESPERVTRSSRWDRVSIEADIETLICAAEVGDEAVERFKSYLLEVYGASTWSDVPTTRFAAIRDRLRALSVEERRQTILDKSGVANAA